MRKPNPSWLKNNTNTNYSSPLAMGSLFHILFLLTGIVLHLYMLYLELDLLILTGRQLVGRYASIRLNQYTDNHSIEMTKVLTLSAFMVFSHVFNFWVQYKNMIGYTYLEPKLYYSRSACGCSARIIDYIIWSHEFNHVGFLDGPSIISAWWHKSAVSIKS